jgi:protoporphyrinogen/coproporphyrinogen III oxidase
VPTSKKILVIGGGISGLACAWRLRQSRCDVLLLERSGRFGGVIDTVHRDGFLFDIGPQSFLNTPAVSSLVEELGAGGELVQADARAPRYILKQGRLIPAPLSPPQLLLSSLIGAKTKLRVLSEPFRKSKPPAEDESIAAFVRRKFGEDLLTNLVAPFISGVWAGDPERLSLASAFPNVHQLEERYGSVIRGAMKERRRSGGRPALCNFRQGVATLTAALARKLADSIRAGAEVTAVHRSQGSHHNFAVTYSYKGANHSFETAALVCAVPASEAARLLASIEPRYREILAQIEYVSVAQVAAGYRLEQITRPASASSLNGFGFLVPRTEGLRTLGTVWNSSLFPERVPPGPDPQRADPQKPGKMASFTSFLGGALDPELSSASEAEIAKVAHAELASVLGITGFPAAQHVARWERALPQYNIGHARVLSALHDLCARTSGVFLAGNYLAGPSIGSCIEQANTVAEAAGRYCGAS